MSKAGKLHFHSETGTEGGYFAFQDLECIDYVTPEWALFIGYKVYDPNDIFRRGRVKNAYNEAGELLERAIKGEIAYLDIGWEDGEQSGELVRNDSVLIEAWSYTGLTLLKPKDRLTIYERGIGSIALWDGIIEMQRQDPYAEASYTVFGLASHYQPLLSDIGADDWSQFFMEERYASLEQE